MPILLPVLLAMAGAETLKVVVNFIKNAKPKFLNLVKNFGPFMKKVFLKFWHLIDPFKMAGKLLKLGKNLIKKLR